MLHLFIYGPLRLHCGSLR